MVKSPLSIADFPEGFESRIAANLQDCRQRIAAAAQNAGRQAEEVALLPVTKYVDSGLMRVLHSLGIRDFGENRSQEAVEKHRDLSDLEDLGLGGLHDGRRRRWRRRDRRRRRRRLGRRRGRLLECYIKYDWGAYFAPNMLWLLREFWA